MTKRRHDRRLRIALIASNRFPIRQPFAGGLEAHVWHLARALAARGHSVSLFAANGSDPAPEWQTLTVRRLALSHAAQTRHVHARRGIHGRPPRVPELMLELARSGAERFDVVHNHSLHHLPVAMAPMLDMPMLTTVHTPPTPWLESALTATSGEGTRLAAVSRHTAASWAACARDVEVVPNGIDTTHWPLGPGGDELVWFGRITPEKGPHLAIAAAHRARVPLVLAGPVVRPGLLRPVTSSHARSPDPLRRTSHPGELAQSGRRIVGGAGHPDVGRAVRTGGGRGDVLRDAGGGFCPGRNT